MLTRRPSCIVQQSGRLQIRDVDQPDVGHFALTRKDSLFPSLSVYTFKYTFKALPKVFGIGRQEFLGCRNLKIWD